MSTNVISMTRTVTTLTCFLAMASAVALGAQSSETTTKTKIEVENGTDMTVTGCVTQGAAAGDYVLTQVASKGHAMHTYRLVSDNDDFSKVVGHRVQIDGKVGDRGNGKVEIKTETKVDGPTKDTHSKTEGAGPYLGVKHMKRVAGTCK
jgi:hypothetical protein